MTDHLELSDRAVGEANGVEVEVSGRDRCRMRREERRDMTEVRSKK